MRVAFQVEEYEGKDASWKTSEIYTEDGDEINNDKEGLVLKKGKIYKGCCTSWNKKKGTGAIKPDGKGPWTKPSLKVFLSDISCNGESPALRKGLRLQFHVSKDGAGYKAVKVTLSGGRKVPSETGKKVSVRAKASAKKTSKKALKRKLSKVTNIKNSRVKKAKKAIVSVARKKSTSEFNHSELPSGTYGGMEIDEEEIIEVGIILRSHWMGSIIGKKGATIKEIRKLSEANMQCGDNEVEIDGGFYKVFAISGTMNQVADACKIIAEKLGEAAQTLEFTMAFLVPDKYCGMFVGKKGSTINEIRGDMEERVRVNLSREPIQLPGSNAVTVCTVFGPRENVKGAIERTVAVLGAISIRMKQWGGGNWNGPKGASRRGGKPRRGGRW